MSKRLIITLNHAVEEGTVVNVNQDVEGGALVNPNSRHEWGTVTRTVEESEALNEHTGQYES